jgi:DNA-binding NarL/FixJ family response regulator
MGLHLLHANDNVLMQRGFEAVIKGGGIDTVDRAANEKEVREALKKESYDLVIMDPQSGPGFSIEIAERLILDYKETRFLIISEVENRSYTLQLMEKGVAGFLTRECDEDEIKHAVFSIAKGEKFYCNKVLDIALNKDLPDPDNCAPTVLSVRENEIAALIASGLTNKEVGEKLHLSHHTVHTHRKNILRKLNINSVSELTLYAFKMGLIREDAI